MIFLDVILISSVLIYGLYLMDKLDLFLNNKNHAVINKEANILIYGCNDISIKVRKYLDHLNLSYDLMVYSLGKKWGRIQKAIAICNNSENKRIYDEYGIMNVDFNYDYSDKFLSIDKGENKK